MGGCVAAMYANQFPSDLRSVHLFCPFGVYFEQFEIRAKAYKETGQSFLIPQNMKELEEMIDLMSYKKVPVPGIIKTGILQDRLDRDAFFRKRNVYLFLLS